MSRLVSFYILIGIIAVFGVMFYRVMATFVVPVFLAVLLVVIFRPVHTWILARCRNYNPLAALLTTLVVLNIVLVPMIAVAALAAIEGSSLVATFNVRQFRDQFDGLRSGLGLEIPAKATLDALESDLAMLSGRGSSSQPLRPGILPRVQQRVNQAERELRDELSTPELSLDRLREALQAASEAEESSQEQDEALDAAYAQFRADKTAALGGPYRAWLAEQANPSNAEIETYVGQAFAGFKPWALDVVGSTTTFAVRMIVGLVIMILSMYFFLADGAGMVRYLTALVPLDELYVKELLEEFDRISRAVVVATLLAAVVQGLLAGVGFYFAGVGSVFLLAMITAVLAMVPFVGATSVWLPVCLWLYFVEGRAVPAIALAVYGTLIISQADNVIKPLVLHGQSRLHPLLAVLSVVGGVQAMGPIGILVGPMVVVFLQTLLKMLHRELVNLDRADQEPAAAD